MREYLRTKDTDELANHIKKYMFESKGLLFEGETWTNNYGKPNEETVISGTFLVVRDLEFRLKMNHAKPGNGFDTLRLTKFNQASGVQIGELNTITESLIEAIKAF